MAGVSRETQMSITASSMFPGFRFSPTDVELISYYLRKKLEGFEECVEVIAEVEICKYEPWDLPANSIIKSDNEWFFFCARGRKYPNGSQSKRATEMGYWKATGKERSVKSGSNVIGTKRTLVFHLGRAPKGERTEWIMHEYCMKGKSQDSLVVCRLRKNNEFHLNHTSNRASLNQGQLSTLPNSNCAASGTDPAGNSEGEKTVECYPKKYTSSYDSHSIEQIDSASESEQKLLNDVTGSSSHHKDSDDEDCFADILNDDIIKLDEATLSAPPGFLPIAASKSVAERIWKRPIEPVVLKAQPFKLPESPLIKFRKQGVSIAEAEDNNIKDFITEKSKSAPLIKLRKQGVSIAEAEDNNIKDFVTEKSKSAKSRGDHICFLTTHWQIFGCLAVLALLAWLVYNRKFPGSERFQKPYFLEGLW